MPFPLTVAVFLASMTMRILMRPKKSKRDNNTSPNHWNPTTTQQAGIPIDLLYGYAKVYGNIISQHTSIMNTGITDIPPADNWLETWIQTFVSWITQGQPIPNLFISYITASKEVLMTRLGFGDGPVLGPDESTFILNGTRVSELTDVILTHRLGTDSQTATGTGDIIQFPCDKAVPYGSPVTLSVSDANADALGIIIYSPDGLIHYGPTGNLHAASLTVKIEIREVGGAWHTLVFGSLIGKTKKPIFWQFFTTGTYDGGAPFTVTRGVSYEWKVTSYNVLTNERSAGALHTWALQQVYTDGFRFPGLVYTEIQAYTTEKLNGSLSFEGVVAGKIVEDVETGELAWSDNPANVIHDLFCRPCIKGTGDSGDPYEIEYYRGMSPTKLYTADFIALKDWCNELVPDGKGGTEKRFVFNGRIVDQGERWEQAAQVAAMCRANIWYDGVNIRVWIDRATTPTQLFCSSNMYVPYDGQVSLPEDGYREWSVDRRSRPNSIETTIANKDSNYSNTQVRKVDKTATTYHEQSIEGQGISSVSQFVRTADFLFAKARHQELMNEFQTDANGLDACIGEVAYVQSDRNGRAVGARVVSATITSVTLDHAVSMDSGTSYKLVVQTVTTTGKHVTSYDVVSVTGTSTVSVASWTYTPSAGDCVIFAAEDKLDMYRIIGVNQTADQMCVFLGEQYKDEYYDGDDGTPSYDTDVFVSGPIGGRSPGSLVTREDISNLIDEDFLDIDESTEVTSNGLEFSGNGVDTVTWEGSDIGGIGWIRVNGTSYPIQSDATGTTKKYIYFDSSEDSANDRTVLQSTDNINDLVGQMRYLGCINVAGVPYVKNWILVGQEGELLELGTMAYQNADAVAVTGGEVTGLDKLGTQVAYFETEYDNGNSGDISESGSGIVTIDWRNGNKQLLTLTSDCELQFVDPEGAANLVLRLVQDGTGGHTVTLPAGTFMVNSTSLSVTNTAEAEDILTLYWPNKGSGCVYRVANMTNFGVPGSGA